MNIVIPGYRNSGPGHWQTLWEEEEPDLYYRIEQDNWDKPVCDDWIERIEEELSQFDLENVILVGHSVGCIAIAHWYAKYKRNVKGAFLVAPSDVEHSYYPKFIKGFAPIPFQKFPFKSIVVTSCNDHLVSLERAKEIAQRWGSRLEIVVDGGHLQEKDGYGYWFEGKELLHSLERQHV